MADNQSRSKWTGLVSFMNISLYLGVVIMLSIGGGYWLGRFLDEKTYQDNVFTILFLIIGGALAFYMIIRRLMEIGRGEERRR